MPVRNGYEVCWYVKEDSSLAHIPVILLVGAFDPLDEQEAQRVGADGVLKKPFVPPDPLISMVKSALARAGVSLGPASAADKAPAPPKRSTADILSGGSKMSPVVPEKLPEISPEPLEDFSAPTAAPHLRIAAGSEPLAFGSLLDTSDAEDMAITAKPMIELAKDRKWDDESDEPQEEKEEAEESSSSVWRPGAIDDAMERVAEISHAAPDWRDEAFHGNSPANSFASTPWVSPDPAASFAESAGSQTVAVATVESKPATETAPFAGDAWAAAMAAGVEEKFPEAPESTPAIQEAQPAAEVREQIVEQVYTAPSLVQDSPVTEAIPVQESAPAEAAPASSAAPVQEPQSEPANWAAAPQTAWEMEAKKASLLASTWDSPKTFSVDETQEIPAYSPENHVEHAAVQSEAPAEASVYSAEPIVAHDPEEKVESPVGGAVQESAPFEAEAPKSLENAWEAPAAVAEPAVEAHPAAEQSEAPAAAEEAIPASVAEVAKPSEPDMDELVARVLGKMNPEVLQKVTREILKPVIEAIVRDEINSKKS
jgi:hypothetical protein